MKSHPINEKLLLVDSIQVVGISLFVRWLTAGWLIAWKLYLARRREVRRVKDGRHGLIVLFCNEDPIHGI